MEIKENDSNIIEIHEWLREQVQPNKKLDWNDWKNIHALLKPRIGKTLYTKSCWADIRGLYEATLHDEYMTVKIGDKLKKETIEKRGELMDDTYSWLTWNRIYVDKNTF